MGERPYPLILANWPMPDARALDADAGPEIDWLIRLVSGIRGTRAELNVPPGAKLALHVRDAEAGTIERLQRHEAAIMRLARLETIGSAAALARSEEHTSELQSLMRISYAVFCLKKKKTTNTQQPN